MPVHDLRQEVMSKKINSDQVRSFLYGMFENNVHAKRVLSISNAVLGVIMVDP